MYKSILEKISLYYKIPLKRRYEENPKTAGQFPSSMAIWFARQDTVTTNDSWNWPKVTEVRDLMRKMFLQTEH